MKRENKFRGWSEKEQCYIFNKVNYLIDFTGAIFYQYGYNQYKLLESDLIIEQYTGRTDQHRMELYEGDIIEFRFRTKHDNELHTGKIYFDEFMYLVESTSGEVFSLNRINSVTLLGNIHEHPHLFNPE